MSSSAEPIIEDLQRNLRLYQEIAGVVELEGRTLRQTASGELDRHAQAKKDLLPRLIQSLDQLRKHRAHWQRQSLAERERYPEVTGLLRQCQETIMKIVLMDRENEQMLLRKGLVPAGNLPSVNRQRPHFVADLYRRQGAL